MYKYCKIFENVLLLTSEKDRKFIMTVNKHYSKCYKSQETRGIFRSIMPDTQTTY